MIVFPNAKLNLGLNVIEKRNDGFHEIQTVIIHFGLCDALEIVNHDKFLFSSSGIPLPDEHNENICIKAYNILKEEYDLPPVGMFLHKNIPVGAGLGGGSADAAYTLKLLNDLFDLRVSKIKLHSMAATLGSDCAFFLQEEPVFASGRGEILEPLAGFNLKGWYLIVITPAIHVSTPDAYKDIIPSKPPTSLKEIILQPAEYWKDLLINDFEQTVFKKHPLIAELKAHLYKLGATYASMSGSGSSLFGLFREKPKINIASEFDNCKVWEDLLVG